MLRALRQGIISKCFSSYGQEAVSVATTLAMQEDEWICTMHRNLGVFTSRNIPLEKLFSQFQGKPNGFTKGRDRSFHFGSKEHNIRLRQEAINRGLRLNEFCLFPESLAGSSIGMEAAKHTLLCSDESEIYKNLDMHWVPPEMREDMGEIEGRIVDILEEYIKPAVAQDGGNIAFMGYKDKIVEVQLQGACSGCPSSTMTLKNGILSVLQKMVPTLVDDVVAVNG